MNFTLSKEQKLAQQLFRDFTSKEVEPLAREIDENHSFPGENVKKMQKYGFHIPKIMTDRAVIH